MEASQSQRASFAKADRTGAATGQEAESPRLAIHPHSLLQRALSRCPTSGGKPRSAHSRRGRAKTRHAREESSGRGKTQRRRISTAAPQARLHRQEEREGPSPPRNSNYG